MPLSFTNQEISRQKQREIDATEGLITQALEEKRIDSENLEREKIEVREQERLYKEAKSGRDEAKRQLNRLSKGSVAIRAFRPTS